MATYALNEKLNGIEITFDNKPSTDTLTALKSNGFRWHRQRKIWYAKQTEERMKFALSISNECVPIERINKQDELKAIYIEILTGYWKEPRMINHCLKNTALIVSLDDGDIATIEKPTIETHFCFGYGYCGVSTEEDYKSAHDTMNYARTHEDYFISENLKNLNLYIERLEDNSIQVYKYNGYCGHCDTRLKGIGYYRLYEEPSSNLIDCKKLSQNERDNLIAGYKEVKKQFEKRLQTYLKKYGLSKLHTWTYLSD